MNGWLAAIKSGTILALQKSASGLGNSSAKALSKELGLIKETGHEDLIHSILSMNQIELSLSTKRKEEIFEVEGNKECADCHVKGIYKFIIMEMLLTLTFTFILDPDWASLSFGILICIKCSGIHRSLGVHLSKVRSLALDFWNPEHVELMKCIGNKKSWNIFEESYVHEESESNTTENNNKNKNFGIAVVRAEPNSSQQVKEKWILAKYVERQFVKFPGSLNLSEEEKVEIIRTVKKNEGNSFE